jgi:REP element-mobilizing transposase RayT
MGRREIFETDRDREHFIELLSMMVERYCVVLHAYVLMDNHYHLLIETPEGNASRALQWLNLSHAAWFKAKHSRSGPLFQARFKSIPVDGEGSWALTCSAYIHLNPVRIRSLGQGKEYRAREKADSSRSAQRANR